MRRDTQRRSRGLFGFVERHRVATTFVALFLISSPARPDDRQLLQANAGAPANVLIILDSSYSMNNEFSDTYRLPAFHGRLHLSRRHHHRGRFQVRGRQARSAQGHDERRGRELGVRHVPQPRPDVRRRGHVSPGQRRRPGARLRDRRRQDGRPGPGERRRRVAVLRRPARGRQPDQLRLPVDSLARRPAGPLPADGPQGHAALRPAGPARPGPVPARNSAGQPRPALPVSRARPSSRAAGAAPSVRTA